MLASISPLGERARGNRWSVTAVAYGAASIGAAAMGGAVLGGLGAAFGVRGAAAWWVLGCVALTAAIADGAVPDRLPTIRRQVDEDWLVRYRGWVYGAGFGAQLGLGIVTIVTTATVYAWIVGVAVSGGAGAGTLVGAAFGAARAVPLFATGGVRTASDLRAMVRRMSSHAGRARWVAAAASMIVGAGSLVAAVRP